MTIYIGYVDGSPYSLYYQCQSNNRTLATLIPPNLRDCNGYIDTSEFETNINFEYDV